MACAGLPISPGAPRTRGPRRRRRRGIDRLRRRIGEHLEVREVALAGTEWMGIHMDSEANRTGAEIIRAKGSPIIVLVISTENLRHCKAQNIPPKPM